MSQEVQFIFKIIYHSALAYSKLFHWKIEGTVDLDRYYL